MGKTSKRAGWALATVVLMLTSALVTHTLDARRAAPAERLASVNVSAAAAESPLERFETERQQLRARQRAQLNDLLHTDGADEESLREARRQLLGIMDAEEKEARLQGILRARGYAGAVVSLSTGSANVLVPGEALNRQETAAILDLTLRETGLTGGNVKIIPVN